MTDQELHDLIAGDAQAKAKADAGDDTGAAERASAIAPKVKVPIGSAALLAWAGDKGLLVRLDRLRADATKSDRLRSVAWAALLLIQRDGTKLDPNDPRHVGMIQGMTQAGVLTAGEAAELTEMSERPQRIDANRVSAIWNARYRGGN
jgi:hypothetical protein